MNFFVAMRDRLLAVHEINRVDADHTFAGTATSVMRIIR